MFQKRAEIGRAPMFIFSASLIALGAVALVANIPHKQMAAAQALNDKLGSSHGLITNFTLGKHAR